MIFHEDLQLQQGELAIAFFDNLPAYCLEFVKEFYEQFYKFEPKGSYFWPKDVKQAILPTELMDTKQRV
jgi:hypothetical protein